MNKANLFIGSSIHSYKIEIDRMNKVAVFCGSSIGTDDVFCKQAYLLGRALAERGCTLVYGGSNVGLMGRVADGALDHNGKVIGVLPRFLEEKEIAHQGLTELILVDTMHERKARMGELADGVIALPGSFGTMEELFEMLTWGQLGLHKKPVGLLNVDGFYDELLAFVKTMVRCGFLKGVHEEQLLKSKNIDDLFAQMAGYKASDTAKWGVKFEENHCRMRHH